jgi:pimeloyl-ACP methyl ester carboxylesterase
LPPHLRKSASRCSRVNEELIARLRAARPDVAIGLFADAGHWVPYEAADAFNDFLLARLDAAAAPAGRVAARRNLSIPQ